MKRLLLVIFGTNNNKREKTTIMMYNSCFLLLKIYLCDKINKNEIGRVEYGNTIDN